MHHRQRPRPRARAELAGQNADALRAEPNLGGRHLPAPSGAALRAKAPPFGYLAPLDSYVWTDEGWLYVAGVPDLCSRRIVGLAGAEHLETSLPEAALAQAIARSGTAAGLLHHSDRGVQYASERHTALLGKNGITPSMSRRANCYDNAHMESFWGTLKAELLSRHRFATRREAWLAILDYVETFYNRVRLHSALDYQSPVDYQNNLN